MQYILDQYHFKWIHHLSKHPVASPWRNKCLIESPFRPLLTDNPGLPYIECLMESRWPKRRKSAVSGRQWCELILITPINTRTVVAVNRYVYNSPGLTLGLCPANERRRYFLRPSQWEMALLFYFIFIKTYLTRMTYQPEAVLHEVLPYTITQFIHMVTRKST